MLPREKPLPKPKPLTKWERFANAKGISHSKKDKNVWDEDRQEFVARWGRDGLNKKVEEQWITEVKVRPGTSPRPHSRPLASRRCGELTARRICADGTEVDPAVTAKEARKARVAKNVKQQEGNIKAAAKRAGPAPATTAAYAGGRRGADSKPVPVSIGPGRRPQQGRP
jgi:regulator of ribosome biosynthesis